MVKLALPAGDIRPTISELLVQCGLGVEGYGEGSRSYRLRVPSRDEIRVRVFREKDIPIQVALGNYDLGVCSLVWVKEVQARFGQQAIVPICGFDAGSGAIYAAATPAICSRLEDLDSLPLVRLASEYPNLTEAFALAMRLSSYRVQPVWGAAEAYPPEDADCVILSARDEEELRGHGLGPLRHLMENSAWLVANAGALATKDLSALIGPMMAVSSPRKMSGPQLPNSLTNDREKVERIARVETLRMAVPDGHQQRHAVDALLAGGLKFAGYGDGAMVRRPASPIEELEIKVIRPHDMPSLVATGEIDVAITGRDCLLEHQYSFPTTPAVEVLDLRRGQYNLSAVATDDLPANTIGEALDLWRDQGKKVVRIASEFPATADHYARSRHFWRYQVIPIAGASEGFVPEDADLLIEGTETGKTLAENHLKVIDLLYRSTTCIIAHKNAEFSGRRRQVFEELMSHLRTSSERADSV